MFLLFSKLFGDAAEIQFLDVQQQQNVFDCGFFAFAFLIAKAQGRDPARLVFDPEQLRSHFVSCLLNKYFDMFPVLQTKKPRENPIVSFVHKSKRQARTPARYRDDVIDLD